MKTVMTQGSVCKEFKECPFHFFFSIQAIPWKKYPSWAKDGLADIPVNGTVYGPVAVLDDHVLSTAWEKGRPYNDVPFVVGTTEQETDYR